MSASDSFHRLISYPVYVVYWAIGISVVATFALGYFNAEHTEHFRNVLDPLLSDPKALWIYERRYEVIFVCLLFVAARYYLALRNEKRKWHSIIGELYEVTKRFDDLDAYLGPRRIINDQLSDHITSELTRIANCNCNILTEYTGRSCHVAIKLLGRDGAIETAARSQAGSTHRRDIDDHMQSFSYSQNTAFATIVDGRAPFFSSNRLRLRSWFKRYKNSHKGWQKSYGATCVVPIASVANSNELCIDTIYGFVCVDNKGGSFDDKITPLLLSATASRCVTVLLRISEAETL